MLAITYTIVLLVAGCAKDGKVGSVKDNDGNTYKTIQIGNQVWMAENLRVKTFKDGSTIEGVRVYDDKDENVSVYGRLYTFSAATNDGLVEKGYVRGACPKGWHIPTDSDWKELETYIGLAQEELDKTAWRGTTEGGKLKETGTAHWAEPNTEATNSTGFSAMPGGSYNTTIGYTSLGLAGYYWSSTAIDEFTSWSRALHHSSGQIGRYPSGKDLAASIRCVKN